MNAPSVEPKRLSREAIEDRTQAILREHGLTSVPIDPVVLAAKTGIRVNNAVFAKEGISGMIAKRGTEVTLLVNQNDHPYRKRFTIAHELGHHFLHLGEDGEFVDPAANLFRGDEEGPRPHEWQANQFAAALLMPRDLVAEEIARDRSLTLEELAARFRVSESAMGIRLDVLGLELPVEADAKEALGT